jgi:hypothetical protein
MAFLHGFGSQYSILGRNSDLIRFSHEQPNPYDKRLPGAIDEFLLNSLKVLYASFSG